MLRGDCPTRQYFFDEAFSMLLTFTPSQGGVFIALQKVMGWTHEAE